MKYRLIKLALKIDWLCQSDSKSIFNDLPKDDPKRRKPNIEMAKSKFKLESSY